MKFKFPTFLRERITALYVQTKSVHLRPLSYIRFARSHFHPQSSVLYCTIYEAQGYQRMNLRQLWFTVDLNVGRSWSTTSDPKHISGIKPEKQTEASIKLQCKMFGICSRWRGVIAEVGHSSTQEVLCYGLFTRNCLIPCPLFFFQFHHNNGQNGSVTHSVRYSHHHHWYNAKQ